MTHLIQGIEFRLIHSLLHSFRKCGIAVGRRPPTPFPTMGRRPRACVGFPGGLPLVDRTGPGVRAQTTLQPGHLLSPLGEVLPDSCSEVILLQFPFYSSLFPPQREAVSPKKSV